MDTCFTGPVRKDKNRLTISLLLDPSQPYLAHHKVGGIPLLGNVMAIEAMCTAATLTDLSGKMCIEDVRGPKPCFVHTPRTIFVEAIRRGNNIDCRLLENIEGREEVYFTARISFGTFDAPVVFLPQLPERPVPGEEVYRLYFHGPAFQEIESAWLTDRVMYTKMNRLIPPAFNKGISVTAPLLIELCLQTAGLWEVASSGRMLIPETIGRIIIHEKIVENTAEVIALAHKGIDGMDAILFDLTGKVYIEVRGYHTAPLPVPVDESAIQRLKAMF